jgi:hypothetical protein
MVMQKSRNKNKGFKDSQHARSEEELYKKAIVLLDKCKIEAQR